MEMWEGGMREGTNLLAYSLPEPLYIGVMRRETPMRLHHLFQKRLVVVDSG